MQMVIDSDPIVGAIKLLFTVNGNWLKKDYKKVKDIHTILKTNRNRFQHWFTNMSAMTFRKELEYIIAEDRVPELEMSKTGNSFTVNLEMQESIGQNDYSSDFIPPN